MSWPVDHVIACMEETRQSHSNDPHILSVSLFDPDKLIGIGVDGSGKTVLVLPGQHDVLAFSMDSAAFDPWTSVTWQGENSQFGDCATLRCTLDLSVRSNVEAVAALFVGLIDLQERFGSCGQAIWELKSLFENGLNNQISAERIVGLFGELLVISLASNPSALVQYWHSISEDKYDFSKDSQRLEVKTSRSSLRHHKFSSFQVPGVPHLDIHIASILVQQVESGTSLSELFTRLAEYLNPRDLKKVASVVMGTLGVPPAAMIRPQFDLASAIRSLRIYDVAEIPFPRSASGVLSMEWLADLAGDPRAEIAIDDLFE